MKKITGLYSKDKLGESDGKRVEYCCICRARTKYTFDVPVQERENYIAGIGQLCPECAYSVQKESAGIFVENC